MEMQQALPLSSETCLGLAAEWILQDKCVSHDTTKQRHRALTCMVDRAKGRIQHTKVMQMLRMF